MDIVETWVRAFARPQQVTGDSNVKKICSVLFSIVLTFGFAGTSSADFLNPIDNWGTVIVPDSFSPANNSSTGDIVIGSFVEDDYLFRVDVPASLLSSATTSAITGTGFSSFGTELFRQGTDGGWVSVVMGSVLNLGGNSWLSVLNFTPLAADPTQYAFRVFGQTIETLAGASYGGSVSFSAITTPIPEPEIYAMMVAGLGLMGFVARRRKQLV